MAIINLRSPRYCLRRTSSRLFSSSLTSNAVAKSQPRGALPIQTTTPLLGLSQVPYHSTIQTRWNSSASDESNHQSSYSQQSTGSPVATGLRELSRRELRHEILDKKTNPPSETIYVGNLFWDLTAERLRSKMEEFGTVVSAMIVFDSRGISKGFGYVQFSTTDDAMKAVAGMHMQILEGRKMTVQYARGSIQANEVAHPPSTTLFIGNLPFGVTDRDLQDLFKDVHGYYDVRFPVDRRSGLPRGFAHAQFLTVQLAEQAMEILRRKLVLGRKLRINFASSLRMPDLGNPGLESNGRRE